jgi:hypothetical protein
MAVARWTADEDAIAIYREAQRLWATGMGKGEIAAKVGITPNQLAGIAAHNRRDFPSRFASPKVNPRRTSKSGAGELKTAVERMKALPSIPVTPEPPKPSPPRLVISNPARCQYPTGEGFNRIRFDCTRPAVFGFSYCREHTELCFSPGAIERARIRRHGQAV